MSGYPPSTPVRGGLYRTITAQRVDNIHESTPTRSHATFSIESSNSEPVHVEKRCILRIHDEATSKEDVVVNCKHFSREGLREGHLMAIMALKSETTGARDFQTKSPITNKTNDNLSMSVQLDSNGTDAILSREGLGKESRHNVDEDKKFIFAVKDLSNDLRTKQPQTEISISKYVADAFGFKNRSTVLFTSVDVSLATASHVELSFKDEYLARSDMWRLTVSELSSKAVYKGQKISFLDTIKATVTAVYVAGRKVRSAFFSTNTKPIFRSESARFVLFIQMSREMWDFDSEGSGEIMFTKVVNGFLPALFKRWVKLKARHLVSIVLFTRVEYDTGITNELDADTLSNHFYTGTQSEGNRKPYKDFYRVVVSEMASGEWAQILEQLKREFRFFRHDITMQRLRDLDSKPRESLPEYKGMGSIPGTTIEAEPSLAVHGNILEAINLASTQFSQDHIDRDLVRTGISIVIISPGSGLFEVNYDTLRTTTETLVSTGIGIDLVCLPKIPLHSVPLFRYRNPQFAQYQDDIRNKTMGDLSSTPRQTNPVFGSYKSLHGSLSPSKISGSAVTDKGTRSSISLQRSPDEWSFAIPHWLDVSFWTGASQDQSSQPGLKQTKKKSRARNVVQPFPPFAVRCKMYELEMAGESTATQEISIPSLRPCLKLPPHEESEERSSRIEGYQFFPRSRKHSSTADIQSSSKSSARVGHLNGRTGQLPTDISDAFTLYDKEKAFHSRYSPRVSKGDPKKQLPVTNEKTVKAKLAEDSAVFGTSFSSTHGTKSGMSLVGAAMGSRKNDTEGSPVIKGRKESFSSIRSAATGSGFLFPRPPKLNRQISLGARGFGISAPKAAVAAVQVENVNAAGSSSASVKSADSGSGSGGMASQLLAGKLADTGNERPPSSQGSLRSARSTSGKATDPIAPKDAERARPIAIAQTLPPVVEDSSTHTVRSNLGSTYQRAEASHDPEQLPTLEKLKSSDTIKASKANLFKGPNISDLSANLSPTTALSPWLNVLNPSNPKEDQENVAGQYKRWQHIFPKPNKLKAMKWKSLCSPASVPLTTGYFPSKLQLDKEYEQKVYTITQNLDEDLNEEPEPMEDFMRELISLRLSQGFQIVVGMAVAEAFGQKMVKITNPFDKDNIAEDGCSVFMSLGNVIHQLSCVNGSEVEVNMFSRKIGTQDASWHTTYKPGIRTTLAQGYDSREITLFREHPESNWNSLDSYIAGYDEDKDNIRYWRARFVLIPMEAQRNVRKTGEDTDEEVRIEGIRSLTQMWQKHRYEAMSERSMHFKNAIATKKTKNSNPLDIIYRTQDPSVVVSQELETLPLEEGAEAYTPRGRLLFSSEPFRQSKLDLAALAEAIQAPVGKGGVRMQNRRWHFRLHYNCFIGSDMTTWLLENFEDLKDREDAVELGNRLMLKEEARSKQSESGDEAATKPKEQGLFVHVERRHPFRDGLYFYQVAGEHAKTRPETRSGWGFSTRRKETSIPSTPLAETASKESPKPSRVISSAGKDENGAESGGTNTPAHNTSAPRPQFYLSKVLKYNVDPKGLSYRPERINLHYDRLHNPDNCYHIRIDWMNVTAKLIEDAIQSWAKTAERHKLRLIEVPIAEASSISEIHPFRSPFIIKLAKAPPEKQPSTFFDSTSLGPMPSSTKHFYQKAILKKFEFVLDMEAASYFPSNVDISYSWGKPNYRYTQYVHRSGVGLAQITDEGDILLLANKLYNNRAMASKEAVNWMKYDNLEHHNNHNHNMRIASSTTFNPQPTPTTVTASPMLRATHLTSPSPSTSPSIRPSSILSPTTRPLPNSAIHADVLPQGTKPPNNHLLTPDRIKRDIEEFCSNAEALERFYKETLEKATNPVATPKQRSSIGSESSHTLDANIPSFGLGPSLLSREANSTPLALGGNNASGLRMSLTLPTPGRKGSAHPSDDGGGVGEARGYFAGAEDK